MMYCVTLVYGVRSCMNVHNMQHIKYFNNNKGYKNKGEYKNINIYLLNFTMKHFQSHNYRCTVKLATETHFKIILLSIDYKMTMLKLKNHILNINIYKSKRNKYIDNLYYLIIHSIRMTQATVLLHAAIFKHIYIFKI